MNYYANWGQDWKEETYCNSLGKSGLTFMRPVGDVRSCQMQNVLVDLCKCGRKGGVENHCENYFACFVA